MATYITIYIYGYGVHDDDNVHDDDDNVHDDDDDYVHDVHDDDE